MDKINPNASIENRANTLRDYINLVKDHLRSIVIITTCFLVVSTIYAIILPDIYTASTVLKITEPKTIMDDPLAGMEGFSGLSDRFIANEIETIQNSSIIDQVAETVEDTFKTLKRKNDFHLILSTDFFGKTEPKLKRSGEIRSSIAENMEITQKNNLDFIEIAVKSPSPKEAALIANVFAYTYQDFNLQENRKQVTIIKDFLEEQKEEKLDELMEAEDEVKKYQLQKGVVELDWQAQALISRLSDFESQKNAAKIEMSISEQKLNQYQEELKKRDPSLSSYLYNKTSEPYLTMLQEQIAKLKTQKDIAFSTSQSAKNKSEILKDYDSRIKELQDKLNKSVHEYRNMILSASPEEIKDLTQKVFEEDVKNKTLQAQYNQINGVVANYEGKFNQLPSKTLDLARLERQRMSVEKLYSALEEKYQEALINEQSIPGNVLIMNKAWPPSTPSEPNRIFIIIFGAFAGAAFSFGFVYIRNYFDRTIKSPEDIEYKKIELIGWVPKVKELHSKNGIDYTELILLNEPDSISSEAFRTLRTRVQFSKYTKNAKTLLVTSSAPGEGKTIISVNLAASFAQANKKSIIVDCDLRKPRVHRIFNDNETPGFLDYLFGKLSYENIIRKTEIRNLDFIPAGTIPPNPSEIMGSRAMKALLQKLKEDYDIVVIDSPPVMAVSDAEILAQFVDASILIVSAHSTEVDWLEESVNRLKNEQNNFAGIILNNFNFKSGYHSYYKYYDHYSAQKKGHKRELKG
ncbi:MAG TPA: polysaccharide biosynthesis tyrosine autokinase [Ignavibacteriaceae bacterium]|nr:polysaccharide biosynthesis tyrosine autokinase [Ignavibacteriaceae bacterium]